MFYICYIHASCTSQYSECYKSLIGYIYVWLALEQILIFRLDALLRKALEGFEALLIDSSVQNGCEKEQCSLYFGFNLYKFNVKYF